MASITYSPLPQGWVRFMASDWPGVLYLRLQPNEDGRWTTREIYIDGDGAVLTPGMMRKLNLSQLEALANDEAEQLTARYDELAVGDLSRLASNIGVGFGSGADPSTDWVASAYFSSAPAKMRAGTVYAGLKPTKRMRHTPVEEQDDVVLFHGPEKGITDEFLAEVAAAYYSALRRGERPNKELARQVHASPRTVEGWVRDARDRGIMPPARKGAAG